MKQELVIEADGKRHRFVLTTADVETHALVSRSPLAWRMALDAVRQNLTNAVRLAARETTDSAE